MRVLVSSLARPFPRRLVLILLLALAMPLLIPNVARAAVSEEAAFVFNTFAFLIWAALVMFMCVELMLNAVNLTFVAAGRAAGVLDGQVAVFFVLVVAAAEVVVGLAIIVAIFRRRETASVDELAALRG